MIKRLKRAFALLVVATLVTCSYVAWSGITGREPIPIPGFLGGGPEQVTGTDSDFDDLKIVRDQFGNFDGTVTVENPTSTVQDVIVSVAIFDGEQNVGQMYGTVTVKPRSASSVDLDSRDGYVSWTDAYVDLTRF